MLPHLEVKLNQAVLNGTHYKGVEEHQKQEEVQGIGSSVSRDLAGKAHQGKKEDLNHWPVKKLLCYLDFLGDKIVGEEANYLR